MGVKNVIILEDNSTTLEQLRQLVLECGAYHVYALDNFEDACACVMKNTIDLFLVDIILDTGKPGDTSGLLFVERIRQMEQYMFTPVIFITSLEDPRMYTYENLHCYGFLEKPFDPERVRTLVRNSMHFPKTAQEDKTLFFRKDGIIMAVNRNDIVYVECINHMMRIHTVKKDYLEIPYYTMKKILAEIDSADMIQCSRSSAVSRKFIHSVDIPNRFIQLKDGLGTVEIGLTYKKSMREMVGGL